LSALVFSFRDDARAPEPCCHHYRDHSSRDSHRITIGVSEDEESVEQVRETTGDIVSGYVWVCPYMPAEINSTLPC